MRVRLHRLEMDEYDPGAEDTMSIFRMDSVKTKRVSLIQGRRQRW
jgi:hypothetical protein